MDIKDKVTINVLKVCKDKGLNPIETIYHNSNFSYERVERLLTIGVKRRFTLADIGIITSAIDVEPYELFKFDNNIRKEDIMKDDFEFYEYVEHDNNYYYRTRTDFIRDLEQQSIDDFKCYCLPCSNFQELEVLSSVYNDLNLKDHKKIIYSVVTTMFIDNDYSIDLFILNEKGLHNAYHLFKQAEKNIYITLEELKQYRKGLLIGKDLEGGDLTIPLPKEQGIIDFIYGIGPTEYEKVKEALPNYKIVQWPDVLCDQFEQVDLQEFFEDNKI